MSAYKQIQVYQDAKTLAVDIHNMTLNNLPRFEMYEQGQQIRRSSKSVPANIVEGYGRRRYKNQFILHLTYAIASLDETKCHLEILCETGSLAENLFSPLYAAAEELGRRLYRFREAVIQQHHSESASDYQQIEE
jgi:four helix bundle protein